MQVIHPQGVPGGVPSEDMFAVVDDLGTQLGSGYVVYQEQPHLYPDCPVNLYFSMNCKPAGEFLLFGALMARARQMRDARLDLRARVYTNIRPDDARSRDFYAQSGLNCEDTEQLVLLTMPQGEGRVPMSCSVAAVPLNTPMEQQAFVARLQQNDLVWVTPDYLASLMRLPHFMALGLYRNTDLIGEILMAGQGDRCELVAMYIIPQARAQGMGRVLLHRTMAIMAAEGVRAVTARIMTRSLPQQGLCRDFRAQTLAVTSIYPGIML